jgi:hypothetical protein
MACLFRVQGVCTSRPPRIHRIATWLGSVVMLLATIHPSAHGRDIADQEKSRPNSCVTAEPDSAGSNDTLFLKVHGAFIRQLLEQEKFKELNCIADSERSSKERLRGGMWKIHEFYWTINNLQGHPSQQELERSSETGAELGGSNAKFHHSAYCAGPSLYRLCLGRSRG